jgi:EAL domain-containing protein (putative c-di-GMP-specific phosphodiesterase class I)
LKIDRSFVGDLAESDGSQLVRGILALAHSLGLRVVAEGVETHPQLQFLTDHACEEAQGFFLAKPMPAPVLEQWLVDWLQKGGSEIRSGKPAQETVATA